LYNYNSLATMLVVNYFLITDSNCCMKKVLRSFLSYTVKVSLVCFVLIALCNKASSQIINEGFEEADWQTITNSTSGAVTITATSASSTMTYFVHPATTSSTFTTGGPFTPNASYTTFVGSTTTTGGNSTRTTYGVHYSSTGINTSPNSGTWWYSRGTTYNETRGLNRAHSKTVSMQLATSGYLITPVVNNGIASLTIWMAPQGAFAVGINTNTTITQPTYTSNGVSSLGGFTYYTQSFAASGTAGNSSMQSFNIPVTFSGPCQVGVFNASSSSIYLDDVMIAGFPTGTLPSLVLNTAVKNGQFGGNAAATITANSPTPNSTIFQSGIIWSTTNTPLPDTSLATKTTNGPSGSGVFAGPITAAITGLTAGATYYVRAYAATSGGLVYSNTLSFITDPPIIPTLTTNAVTGITALSAISGGTFGNDGGAAITAKGVCWGAAANPTIALPTKTNDGTGATNFTSAVAVLAPSTTYHVRAYATNAVGTAYGNDITFTTSAAIPTVLATPNSLNFGSVVINTSSAEKTFTLTGIVLSPVTGSVTVTAPTNYQVSLTSGGGFANSVSVPYLLGSLVTTTIYVRFTPTTYGVIAGNIAITGGGVATQNVAVTGIGIQSPNDYSNKGTDFWVGYASHQNMYNGPTGIDADGGAQTMVLYFTSDQNATVTVSIPGLAYNPAPVAVVANAVTIFTIPNQIGAQYAQLYLEGKSNKGIHITSDIPIVGYAHIYSNFVSGASLLLPTTTWGTEYNSVNYTQNAGSNSNAFSYFFAVAKEDNTVIEITPTNTTFGGRPAGIPFNITLNKGEVYNVLGGSGTDFTGSKIKSLDCNKKIGVFSGNNRTQIAPCSSTSSDNLFQQATPKGAWGTKYLTSQTIGTVRNNIFRVCVSDPTSVVKINGVTLPSATYPTATLQNNFFYEFEDSIPTVITADKPIMVAQYCKSTSGCTDAIGNINGDPEMIFISPIEQAIDKAVLYSSANQEISFHYINVIIPNAGVAGFTLDGVNVSSKFKPHAEPGYSYAALDSLNGNKLLHGKHIIQSTVPFNAIAYGYGNNNNGSSTFPRESYGYNAGTQLKDLTQNLFVQNPYALSASATACKAVPFKFRIVLPYKTADVVSLTWNFNNASSLTPTNTPLTQTAPTSDSTFASNGKDLYVYSISAPYTFTSTGTYPISVTANVNTLDGCSGTKLYNFNVVVTDGVIPNFTVANNYRVCFKDSARFFDGSNGQGYPIIKWQWNFGNSTIDSVMNPVRYYPATGTYNVSLRAINQLGCYADITKTVTVLALPVANFTSNAPVCANAAVQFTDVSTPGGGTINTWLWNFGETGSLTNTAATQNASHTYTTANTFNVKLNVTTADGCKDSITKAVTTLPMLASPAITVGTITSTSVQFNWTAVANATGYEISINSGSYQPVGTSLTYTATGFQPNQPVSITVRALGSLVCQQNTGTATATTVLNDVGVFIPNTFTPNADGKNDLLKGYGNLVTSFSMKVFNQWGEKVFESNNINSGWDGTCKGQRQPVGVYVYVATATVNGAIINKKGTVNLIR
jgi:gliding motility-associated-like protein